MVSTGPPLTSHFSPVTNHIMPRRRTRPKPAPPALHPALALKAALRTVTIQHPLLSIPPSQCLRDLAHYPHGAPLLLPGGCIPPL